MWIDTKQVLQTQIILEFQTSRNEIQKEAEFLFNYKIYSAAVVITWNITRYTISFFRACAALIVQANFGTVREILVEANLVTGGHVTRVRVLSVFNKGTG